ARRTFGWDVLYRPRRSGERVCCCYHRCRLHYTPPVHSYLCVGLGWRVGYIQAKRRYQGCRLGTWGYGFDGCCRRFLCTL
ncbi:hypothetical protein FRC08_016883, partial [Ceratobasidium sp. 394]